MIYFLRKIADTTKANIYFIPSFRQYKVPTNFFKEKILEKRQPLTQIGI